MTLRAATLRASPGAQSAQTLARGRLPKTLTLASGRHPCPQGTSGRPSPPFSRKWRNGLCARGGAGQASLMTRSPIARRPSILRGGREPPLQSLNCSTPPDGHLGTPPRSASDCYPPGIDRGGGDQKRRRVREVIIHARKPGHLNHFPGILSQVLDWIEENGSAKNPMEATDRNLSVPRAR